MKKAFITGSLVIILILAGCTDKKNPVGFQGGVLPKEITFGAEFFQENFSFVDSTFNYIAANKMIVGKYDMDRSPVELRSLIRFGDLPDSLASIESDIMINLPIRDRYQFDEIDGTNLKVGLLETDWSEYDVTWYSATDSTEWASVGADFTELVNDTLEVYSEEDTVYIKLPGSTVMNWIEADSLNFGLVLYTETEEAFLELHASEYSFEEDEGYNPKLHFDYYQTAADTVVQTYNEEIDNDAFIYSYEEFYDTYEEELLLANIRPVRMFIKFDLTDSMFINTENSGIHDEDDFRRMTINRAEIVLSNSYENVYPVTGSITSSAYNILTDTLYTEDNTVPALGDGDYESLGDGTTSDSLGTEIHDVNITNIVQYYCAGEKVNYGIMIRSIYENRDLAHISFATKEDDVPEKRPQLKIIYTPPYLDD